MEMFSVKKRYIERNDDIWVYVSEGFIGENRFTSQFKAGVEVDEMARFFEGMAMELNGPPLPDADEFEIKMQIARLKEEADAIRRGALSG